MKNIFLSIQEKLSEITELQHIDKNWGQLLYEQPPVKFPCALLDITGADYSQMGNLSQTANGIVEITIANLRFTPSSGKAPRKEGSYHVFEIMDKIHQLLHGYTNGEFQPLIRINLQKLDATAGYEIYKASYQTAWIVHKEKELIPVKVTPEVVKKQILQINN
jgi:hypothetical protein